MIDRFPAFLQELLRACPHTGEGVHDWLFRVARQLHAHLPALEIVSLLESRVANCGRYVPRSEIVSAVQNSLGCAWQPGSRGAHSIHPAPKWPDVNQEQREAIIRDGGGLVDLWETSPVRFDDNDAHTEALIDALFPGDSFLCCGLSNSDFDNRLRSEWRGELRRCSSSSQARCLRGAGRTKDGRESRHALSITGPRWFLLVEFRPGRRDDHAAFCCTSRAKSSTGNASFIPVASVCMAGFSVPGTRKNVAQFMRYACPWARTKQDGPVRSS